MEIKRILFPTDFSENSDYAFQHALEYARHFGAKLYVVHVVYFPPQMPEQNVGRVIDVLLKDGEKRLKTLIRRISDPELIFHPEVRIGTVDREIIELARKEKIDVIVMGTHGRTGLAHVFLGSVAERVVRHAPCPVLTVKPPAGKGTRAAGKR
jgi:nucleotide-binding universal stress UspA family protein